MREYSYSFTSCYCTVIMGDRTIIWCTFIHIIILLDGWCYLVDRTSQPSKIWTRATTDPKKFISIKKKKKSLEAIDLDCPPCCQSPHTKYVPLDSIFLSDLISLLLSHSASALFFFFFFFIFFFRSVI